MTFYSALANCFALHIKFQLVWNNQLVKIKTLFRSTGVLGLVFSQSMLAPHETFKEIFKYTAFTHMPQ